MGAGPNGKPGVVFADAARLGDATIGYYGPERQTWKPIPVAEGEPSLYIGWYNAMPPTPVALARRDQLNGRAIRLGDGGEWILPTLREWRGDDGASCCLPRPVTRTASGAWLYGEVLPAYLALWNQACALWDALIEAVSRDGDSDRGYVSYEFPGLQDFACDVLSLNYVLSWREVSALGLFLPGTAASIAESSVDFPTFRAWIQKKTERAAAGENSSLGQED